MQLRSQLVIAAENVAREQNLSSVLILTLSKDMDEQLKLADKVLDIVDPASRNICVPLQRYSVHNPESSYAQVRFFVVCKEEGG